MSTLIIAQLTTFTKTDFTLQVSVKKIKNSEQLQCVVHAHLFLDMTIVLSNFLGTCFVGTNTKCLGLLCAHKDTFQSLDSSDYQGFWCESQCQVRNLPFEQHSNSFFLKFDRGINVFEDTKNQFKMLKELCIVQHVETEFVFTFQTTKILVFMTIKSARPALTCPIFVLRPQKFQLCCLVVMVHIILQKNESRLWKRKSISIFEELSSPITIMQTRVCTKNVKNHSLHGISVSTTHWFWLIQVTKTLFLFSFCTLLVYSKTT